MQTTKRPMIRTLLMAGIFSMGMLTANSCLKEMPESLPERLVWDPEVAFPLGENSYGLDAVSGFDTTLLDLDTITGFPEWVVERDVQLVMEGTMDFNLSSVSVNLDDLDRILFRVNVSNGFPNVVHAQAYFRDGAMNSLDSMFSGGPMVVPPGRPMGTGETIEPTLDRQDALFDRARILSLENATEIFFRATILVSNVDTTLIPFYPGYHFDVKMGAMFDLTLEF